MFAHASTSSSSAAGLSILPRLDTCERVSTMIIPSITISPPAESPQYSVMAPEQFYDKSVLFVPVKTEELGWDEHGLYWNGTYAYPIHHIYDKQGQPIGRRRKGPAGYRFEEYYPGKNPRGAPRTPDQIEMMESEIMDPYMLAESDVVEESNVKLTEPAPARVATCDATVTEHTQVTEDPDSPTLSLASDTTDDGSSICDDASSLWSRSDSISDDDISACTSPGSASPVSAKSQTLEAEVLSAKLEQVASPVTTTHTSKTERTTASDQHQSDRSAKSLRSTSHYSSLVQELSTSPFSSASAYTRSKTTRTSSLSAGPRTSPIFRSSSLSIKPRRPSSFRRAPDNDFSAGYHFEVESCSLSQSWQQTFLDD